MSSFFEFRPKSLSVLKEDNYFKNSFSSDLLSGLTVAIVALPLAMAFAIASGVSPERGLYTAIVAGALISLIGGSRYQVGGPTGAFVVIIYSIILRHGYEGLVIATILAGVILILFGVFKFGNLIKFIPYPVTTGFTTGIALIIFFSQIKDFFGLAIDKLPADFIGQAITYSETITTFHIPTIAIASLSLAIILISKRLYPKIPAPIVAVIVASTIVYLFNIPVSTIESKFGSIPNILPHPTFPDITLEKIRLLFPDALTIALLAGIESLLSAVVADGMSGSKHNSNTELIAQGVANIGAVIFGGISATGAIARTATNVKSGAKTPFSGVFHSIWLMLFMLFLAPLIVKIPLATLSAILFVVAYNMSELKHFKALLKAPRGDVAVLISTFLLTVLIDLNVAVQTGVVLASFLFIKRISELTQIGNLNLSVSALSGEDILSRDVDIDATCKKDVPKGVEVYEINGAFFFGVADKLKETLEEISDNPKVFILRMRNVPMIDATGLFALEEFFNSCQKNGTILILSGVSETLLKEFKHIGFYDLVGAENIFDHIDKALNRAKELL